MIDQTHNLATKPFSRFSRKYLKTSLLRLLYHTGGNYSKQNQQGSILIYLVVVIVVASALGAGIVSMTTTSTFTGLSYNPSDQARFLAQSGLDVALVDNAPDGTYIVDSSQGKEFKVQRNGNIVTVVATVNKGTVLEANFEISDLISVQPPPDHDPVSTFILNRTNLQEATGLTWDVDGDTGQTEIVLDNFTINSSEGNIYSRDVGVNDGLGTGGGDGGLSSGQSVIFTFNAKFSSYSIVFNKFGDNSTARVEGFNGTDKIGEHLFDGSGGESNTGNFFGRKFFDANNVQSFDKLVVTSQGSNAFFIYSIAADF